jgi:uncharacterized protein with PQ loop repeat
MNHSCPTFEAETCLSASSRFGCMPYVFDYNPEFDETVAAFSMALSFLPLAQVYSLIKARGSDQPASHRAVSLFLWILTVFTNLMWLFYGVMYRTYTLVIESAIAAVFCCWVVLLLIKYRYEDKDGYDPLTTSAGCF